MRTWFAVYAIPPADDPRYRLGSALLGYDIRAEAPAGPSPVAGLEPRWSEAGRGFGFHVTVAEAYAFDSPDDAAADARLERIAREVAELVAGCHPESVFELEPDGLVRWRENTVWALRYRASRPLDLLQAALAARLAPWAEHSMFLDEDARHPERYTEPWQRARIGALLTPRGLDTWRPHATLLNPYDGPDDPDLVRRVERIFAERGTWRVDRLALTVGAEVREGRAPTRWRIAREFLLPGGERVTD